jgi:ABC-type multidrug transport system fused ATPase/permease subunit
LGPVRLPFIGVVGLTLSVGILNLAGPYLIKAAIDGAIIQSQRSTLLAIVGLFVALNFIKWFVEFAHIYSLNWVGQRVIYEVRRQLFEHLQRLSLSFYDHHEVGRIMSRMLSDVGALNELVTSGLVGIISDVFTLGGIIAVMLAMDAGLSLLTLGVVPLMALATARWRQRARDTYRQVRRAISAMNGNLQENISGVRVVQSFCREDENMAHFEALNHRHFLANLDAARLTATFFPAVDIMGALATAIVIVVGGYHAIHGHLTPGVLVAFILYIGRFFDPIRDLSQRYNAMQAAMAAGERIFELVDTPPLITDQPGALDLPPIHGHVRFEHVHLSYVKGTPVLHDINLDIPPGTRVALVGVTGSGKTSLVSLIPRFYEPDRGRITIDGHDIRAVTLQSLRRQIGIVLQDTFLFSGTVRDNIRYGRLDATDEDVEEAARIACAHEFISSLPHGYDTEVQERGSRLSMGQRQLIALARAILANPRLLILDEATSSVDTQTEKALQEALERILIGRTAFIIAHRLSTIVNADLVVVMDQGRIVDMGTHRDLLARAGLYRRLYALGFRHMTA